MRLHSWLNPKCRVARSSLEGMGVFAVDAIPKGTLVCVWGGVVYTAAEIDTLGHAFPHFRTHPYEVAEGFYLGSTSVSAIDDAERFNHGCEPNVGVRGQILVAARRDIAVGEELLFDYETTDLAPAQFLCRCGAAQCRGMIDGSAWQSKQFQLKNAGWLTTHVADKAARS